MRLAILFVFAPLLANAQVAAADYQRALGLHEKLQALALNIPGPVSWIEGTHRFWFRNSIRGGSEFVIFDADSLKREPAFDHRKIADALSAATGRPYGANALPFSTFRFTDRERAIRFPIGDSIFQCSLSDSACKKVAAMSGDRPLRPPADDDSPAEFDNNVADGMVTAPPQSRTSPDGKWEARIRNYNVFLKPAGKTEAAPLSFDGSEGNYYTLASIAWSPDSKHLAAYRVRTGYVREVHYIESSPADQVQPKHSTRRYAKPGDTLDIAQPTLFNIAAKKQLEISSALFPNPYSLSPAVWRHDSRAFTFEYNQRGHQVYRVIEVDAETANARAVISEESKTFIDYRPLIPNPRDTGKKVRYDVNDGKEVIWMSERDGWAHLYLYDGVTGKLENQITKGEWVVRAVDRVDEANRQIWFQASGMYPGKDPYFVHNYRINFDGTGLTAYTDSDGDHAVTYSSDWKYYVDTWSRVDAPPVMELRRTKDKSLVREIQRGDIQELLAAGWRPPEVFTAPGRDGKTGIWGVIHRPIHFDPSRKYPVIEKIYAGPQGSFVPKDFGVTAEPLAELGFIVAQIDGMGTNNRSKAFHDTAWKNLADAGFPDRILWHKSAAARYPQYDISRVGVFGNSAGGQNSLGALLFHPEFYKVAVSSSGCHDNRMDKIWWNEQWMGWPVGPEYAASSNVDHAGQLQGKVLLVVGEMDTNVDPASTLQVVNALIHANKKFDLLFIPGGGHGLGGAYGERLLCDFFVHNLLGEEPPDWNR